MRFSGVDRYIYFWLAVRYHIAFIKAIQASWGLAE